MSSHPILLLASFISSLGFVFCAHSAEFKVQGPYLNHIEITGDITQADVPALEKILGRVVQPSPEREKTSIFVTINSRGGDWDAAMKIGRLLRRGGAQLAVHTDEYCLSACVIVLAGAPIRVLMPGARVGIHRPYSTFTGNISIDEAQKKYRALETNTRTYLQEMNMPSGMFDTMISVPPENIRILSEKELSEFRLDSNDPAAQEVDDAKWASYYKLTKQEYLSRKNLVTKKCNPLLPLLNEPGNANKVKRYLACEKAVYEGAGR